MGRLIIEVLTFWIIFQVLRAVFRPRPPQQPWSETRDASVMMEQCHLCKDYLPADRALHAHGRSYCCQDHLQQDRSR